MKTISDYSIYCTQEQTLKAIELGAQIEGIFIPTAEQMISWLEEQEKIEEIIIYRNIILKVYKWTFGIINTKGKFVINNKEHFSSRKEATLAAINAALECLSNKKK